MPSAGPSRPNFCGSRTCAAAIPPTTTATTAPQYFPYRYYLWRGYPVLADLLQQAGQSEQAEEVWEKIITLTGQIVRDYPDFKWMGATAE